MTNSRSYRKRKREQSAKYNRRSRNPYKNATGIEYLDRLLGEDGLKTNVNVNVPPTVFIYAGMALFLGIVGAVYINRRLAKK